MTFKEVYIAKKNLPTPPQEFISEIASATCCKESTVQQWLSNIQTPNDPVKKRISQVLNILVDELFPEKDGTPT